MTHTGALEWRRSDYPGLDAASFDFAIAVPYAVAGFAHDLVLLPGTIIIILTLLHVDVIIALKVSPPRRCVSKTRFNPFYGIPVT